VDPIPLVVAPGSATRTRPLPPPSVRAGQSGRPCWIRIEPGIYRESLTLGGELTLSASEGPGTVQIVASGNADTITSYGFLTLSSLGLFSLAGGGVVVQAGNRAG